MHSLTQKKISGRKQIAKEGSNWGPCGHEATALPLNFALQHLRGEVDSGIPSGMHKVYGECTCDKMADLLMFRTVSK